jgi:uncharacterized protein YjbJ (UPF0337 family)
MVSSSLCLAAILHPTCTWIDVLAGGRTKSKESHAAEHSCSSTKQRTADSCSRFVILHRPKKHCNSEVLVDGASLNPLNYEDHEVLGSELAKTTKTVPKSTLMNNQAMNIPMQTNQMRQPNTRRPVGLLLQSAMAWLAGVVMTTIALLQPLPAMALAAYDAPSASPMAAMSSVAAMPNKAKAAAKDMEGKLQSAAGELTGDTESQLKGKAKQGQASAMKAGEDLKEGAKSVAKKVADATR